MSELDHFNLNLDDDPYWSESSWFSWAIPERDIGERFHGRRRPHHHRHRRHRQRQDHHVSRIDERIRKGGLLIDEAQARLANDATRCVSKYMADQIFSHDTFDLVLDNASMTPREVAEVVLARSQRGSGEAFPALAERFKVRRGQ